MPEATRTPRALVRCPFCLKLNRVDLARASDRPACGQCGKPLLLDRPIKLSDEDFERVIAETDAPVLVDFYADWCGPCRVMAPSLDDVARDRTGRLLVAKLDTDRNPATATKYGVTALPTLVLFHGGREVGRQTGAVPRKTIEALVDRIAVA
jgi:thioredoxin 2